MLEVSANFATKNAEEAKEPVYLVHFDGEAIDYVTSTRIGNPTNSLEAYIKQISGISQSITPEEGKSSFGHVEITFIDKKTPEIFMLDDCGDTSDISDWTESADSLDPVDETTLVKQASHAMKLRIDADKSGYDYGYWRNNQNQGDLSAYQHDWVYMWVYFSTLDYLLAAGACGVYHIGSVIGDRISFNLLKADLVVGWNLLKFDLDNPDATSGNIDWSTISFQQLRINSVAGNTHDFYVVVDSIMFVKPDEPGSGTYQITKLISDDATNLQRKKTVIKGGYMDMDEADMATLMTGWVTDIEMLPSGEGYKVTVTDPLKWLQRKIFRGAEDTPVALVGNPLNILLAVLTSTGNGTNGDYDWYAEENGLGIDAANINTNHIEAERDKWFHGLEFEFDIRKRRKAKDFLENEIFKVLNIYPIVRGTGVFDIKVYRPPLPEEWGSVQEFDEDTIIGLPGWDQNLKGLINEVEFSYDYDAVDTEFDTIEFFIDGTSMSGRGPGNKPLEIESKGLTTARGGANVPARRVRRIFGRYAEPPPIVKFKTLFSRQLSEVGDVVPVTHSKLPNLADGSRGITEHYMEIVKRDIDWIKGRCNFTALYTNYSRKQYAVISPSGTVASGTSETVFTLESDQGAKFEEGWVIDIHRANMLAVATNLTITDITGDQITVSPSIGATPQAGWVVNFSSYDNCIDAQKAFYGFLCDSGNKLGAANDNPHYIF